MGRGSQKVEPGRLWRVGKQIRKTAEFDVSDWFILLSSMILMPVVAAMLRIFNFRYTRLLITPSHFARCRLEHGEQITAGRRVERMVRAAACGGVFRPNCLTRSLVLHRQLQRKGLCSRLMFGTRVGQNDLSAHAWIELDGIVLNDDADVRVRFDALDLPEWPAAKDV